MGKIPRGIGQGLLGTITLLLILEMLCRAVGFATGANDYIETLALRSHLTTRKPPGEFRIFIYGESTIHGSHYGPSSNPARWLEAYLKDFLPGKNIRVVNFARMGQGSDFITRSFRDTVIYKPDLVIFYMGHNFFIPGNRVDQVREREGKLSFRFKQTMRRSVLISSAIRLGVRMKMDRKTDAEEDRVGNGKIEIGPSGIGPENSVIRDSPYYKENLAHHRRNLEKIVGLAAGKKVPLIFFQPVGNLKDFPPSCSAHRRALSAEQMAAWQKAYDKGDYEQAYAMDPTYAGLAYRLGRIHFKNGDLEKARRLFEEARDEDCILLRAPKDVQDIFEAFRESGKAIVIDTEKRLVSEAPGGILGEPIVEDNVHFSIKGHAILGRALAQEIAGRGWIAPQPEWRFEREKDFEAMARELGVTQDLIFSAWLKIVSYFGSKYESRILYAQKAVAMRPDDPQALRHLAWSYWLKGEHAQALAVYKKLSALAPAQLRQAFENHPELQKAFSPGT